MVFVVIVFFIIYYDGEKKRRKRLKGCPVGFLQDEIREAYRQQRKERTDFDREKSRLHSYYKQEIGKLERDNSYLRSKLYK
jgi:hypothetical protein